MEAQEWIYFCQEYLSWTNKNNVCNSLHLCGSSIDKFIFEDQKIIELCNNANKIQLNININKYNDYDKLSNDIYNVCSKYKGIGLGSELISEVNNFIETNSLHGILFCKHQLIEFYSKSNWLLNPNIQVSKNVYTMLYNFNLDLTSLKYNDRLF